MQTTASKPSGQVTASRKSNNSSYLKSQNKKKKSPKSHHGNSKEQPVGPVASPAVSGSWENPVASANNAAPPGFTSSPPKSFFSDAHVRLLRHRALFVFRFLVGKTVELQLVALDERYAGILDCVDPDDFSVVLKNAKRLRGKADAKPFVDGSTVIFKRHQLAQLVADGTVKYTDGVFASGASTVSGEFRTDTEISGRKDEHLYGRELEAASLWLDPTLDTGALEDSVPNGRRHSKNQGKAGWNQFEANEKLFGVVSTYDENIYTTKLDKSKISTEQSRTAEKLAHEIEQQSAAGNFHLQEERGQNSWRGGKHLYDLDEEARYSSVDRRDPDSSSENTYVPPALRKARRQSSADKSQDRTTKALPTIAPAAATTPSPPNSVSAPTASQAAIAPKPLSFSEAVTGRSTVAATLEIAPKASPRGQREIMIGAASPQIAEASAHINGKGSQITSAKSEGTTPKKKDAASGHEQKIESKSEKKTSSLSSSSSSSTTTKLTKNETPMATSKKTLNPNAKEFKLSASAAAFTPTFAVPKEQTLSPYCGNSPVHMPYPHPGVGYPLPMQEEWVYDGAMCGEEGGEMGMPLYMQGCYTVPMGPNGLPMMYPPIMMQQNMRVMGGQRGNYGGYQQQGYNPRGYYVPPNTDHPGANIPYIGDPGIPGDVGHHPPLPPTPSVNETLDESPASVASLAEVESVPASSKQSVLAMKKK